MTILDKIVASKKEEVALRKLQTSIPSLEAEPLFFSPCFSMKKALQSKKPGIIAEFKKKSPSKQDINLNAIPEQVGKGYVKAGVAGISVLTDQLYFGGSLSDLLQLRQAVDCPILRKDFMIDPYQIIEAKAHGADLILLIASILSKEQIHDFTRVAHDLGLEVLLEIHEEAEMEKIDYSVDIVGINNRNLKTFEVDYQQSIRLSHQLPKEMLRISESGLHHAETLLELSKEGFQGFLIGERFMKTENPGAACQSFIQSYFDLQEA